MNTAVLSSSFSKTLIVALLASMLFGAFVPFANAASSSRSTSKLEVSGWIPYWRTAAGTKDARKNLSLLTSVNPFSYSVKSDGTLADTAKIEGKDWQNLFKDARKKNVDIVPTVMWSDTQNIHRILSNPDLRAAHVANIVAMVEDNDFDGVDIDYEGKLAETRPGFSAFLSELNSALGSKDLHCTIEARMPLSARFAGTPPANIEYANDLPALNKVCDRVRIMTYDQQTADIELNREHAGDLYAPVADVAWVEKVIDYMGQDIDKKKMVLGIPTYGYIYQVMPNTSGTGYSYTKIEAFNPGYGDQIAKKYKIKPFRGESGELSLTYVPKETVSSLPSQKELARLAPKSASTGEAAALGALALAKKEGRQAPVTYLTWSDAGAIKQKVDLAKEKGLAGVAVFKFDGGNDPKMWRALK